MFSKKLTTMGDVMKDSTTIVTSFLIDRYERSPLEFEGELQFEIDFSQLSPVTPEQPRYRVRIYRELHRDFVVEVLVVANDTIVFQTADFAQSADEVDDLLCLVHDDAMDELAVNLQLEATQANITSKNLETQLHQLSTQVAERLAKTGQ